jgi:predicted RNase H-like nuclease
MAHNKKRADGRKQRLDLLRRMYRPSERLFKDALARYPRRQLAPDDVLDALANAVTAMELNNGPATLPAKPPVDRCGLPMEMVLPHFA